MKFITVCEDNLYFHWQLQVQHHNFIVKHGIAPENIICLLGYKTEPDEKFKEYAKRIGIHIEYYHLGDLPMNVYSPIIRPHILKKFYKNNLAFKEESVFIHDADITFVELPLFAGITNDNWYLSNCESYLGYDYLKRFGDTLIQEMCNIVGINKQIIIDRDINCGGAQFYGSDLTWQFWDKVENNTLRLYNLLKVQTETNKEEFLKETGTELTKHNAIQVWTAGMWADLWNLHLYKQVITCEELDFTWATQTYQQVQEKKIFHNAGVTDHTPNLFNKLHYKNKTPFNYELNYHPRTASYYYANEINETKNWLKNGNLL